MITIILQVIGVGVLAFLPILAWAYIFSYLNNSELNSKRFLVGIIAGGISVVPVLYLEDILKIIGAEKWSIISLLGLGNFEPFNISISLFITIITVGTFSIIAGLLFLDNLPKIIKVYFLNLLILNLFIIIFLIVYYLVGDIGLFSSKLNSNSEVSIGKIVFGTTGLVLLYYMVVGLLEESSKHFNFIPSSLIDSDSIKKGVVYATFIALGFGFIENILYLYNIIQYKGLGGEFLTTGIFRGIFSLFVHILCSSIVAFGFVKIYLKNKNLSLFNFSYIKYFIISFVFSIAIHAIYDISLTLGFTAIIFIYLIFGYLYITKIFYKE